MRRGIIIISAFIMAAAFSSCQRVISVDLNNSPPKLVIEGNMTNLLGVQYVAISTTVPYSNTNSYPPVSGATVIIIGNGTSYNLKEGLTPGQYLINNVKGKTGISYQMTVVTGGKSYSATSQMPQQVNLDSLGVNTTSVGSKTLKTVSVFYHDPPGVQNQYRFVMYVNNVQVKQVFTISDNLTDGRTINTTLYQSDITLNIGDRVDVEMQCIDHDVYNYWYTLSQQGGNNPSNSATPSNPTSNIDNGALGYFSAHTAQRKSITVQ